MAPCFGPACPSDGAFTLRPLRSLAPGRYFHLLLLGYFEGLDSGRAVAELCDGRHVGVKLTGHGQGRFGVGSQREPDDRKR